MLTGHYGGGQTDSTLTGHVARSCTRLWGHCASMWWMSPLFMGTICPCCERERQGVLPRIPICSMILKSAGLNRKACDYSTSFGTGEFIVSRQFRPGHLDFVRHRILWTLIRYESTKIFIRWSLVSRATLSSWSLLTFEKIRPPVSGLLSTLHWQFLWQSLNQVYC